MQYIKTASKPKPLSKRAFCYILLIENIAGIACNKISWLKKFFNFKCMVKLKKQLNPDLDEKTVENIKKELLVRREQIIEDLKDLGKEEGRIKFPEFGDKSDENAQEIGEYSTNLATDKVLEATLRDIESALERIEKGEYGICKYCKKPINVKRLQARPVASACVECKTKLQSQ